MKNRDLDFKENEGFYGASSDWFYDMYQSQSLWLRRSLVVILVLLFLLTISVITNCSLFPLKKQIPYLYAFDKATGEITILGELRPSQVSQNWEMTRFFLQRYVVNRESYDFDNAQVPYQIAWAMSDDKIRVSYDSIIFSDKAPYKLYGKDKYLTVNVLSISRLNDNTASVRFDKTLIDKNSTNQEVSHEEAIIKWKYDPKPEIQQMLDKDPIGFKVIYYQVSQVNANT